jgi:hypothetical protein
MSRIQIAAFGLVILLVLALGGVAWAGSSASYAINWQVLSGGGAPVSGGNISLNATLGQTAIGPSSSTGYGLSSGYWYGSAGGPSTIYLPVIFGNYVPGPDLVVENVIATDNQVQVVIKNQGDQTVPDDEAHEFWVDLYINPNPVPSAVNQTWPYVTSEGAAWGITWSGSPYTPADPARQALPLEPGESFTLTTEGDYWWQPSDGINWPLSLGDAVYAQVDSAGASYGAVNENHEMSGGPYNNVSGQFTVTGLGGASSPPVEEAPERDIDQTSLPPRP